MSTPLALLRCGARGGIGGWRTGRDSEGGVEDLFDLQDRVTEKVIGAIEPEMWRAEIERAKRRPTESADAHLCYMRGVAPR